eukprot:759882-Hanusia_phi.AAC.1
MSCARFSDPSLAHDPGAARPGQAAGPRLGLGSGAGARHSGTETCYKFQILFEIFKLPPSTLMTLLDSHASI